MPKIARSDLETEIALIKQQQCYDRKLLEEVHAAVIGTEDKPGLKGRVSNIETSVENTKIAGKVFAAIITIALAVLAFLKRGG
jgi:hypothetical protein